MTRNRSGGKIGNVNVISVDPSMSSTGFFCFRPGKGEEAFSFIRDSAWHPMEYMVRLRRFVQEVAGGMDMAIIEDYPFGMAVQRAAATIEAGAVIREGLSSAGVPVVVMPIQVWRSLTIGKLKKSPKWKYLFEIRAKYRRTFRTPDEADAFLMYEAARSCWIGKSSSAACARVRHEIGECLSKAERRKAS